MDLEIKKLLEENLKLSKENNNLLVKIHKIYRWSQITKILYWIIILGIAFGSFYYIKPYLGSLLNLYSGGVSNINSIKDIGKNLDMKNIQELFKN